MRSVVKMKKNKPKILICGNCLIDFPTVDALADHVEKEHQYKKKNGK